MKIVGWLLAGLLLIVVASVGLLLFPSFWWDKPLTKGDRFTDLVMPVPTGMEIVEAAYRGGREWSVVFQLRGTPEGIAAIVKQEKLELLDPNSPQARTFWESEYRHFKRPGMADPDSLLPGVVYYDLERKIGIWEYLFCNEDHTEAFLYKTRW